MTMRLATVDAVSGPLIKATMSIESRGKPVMGQYVVLRSDDDMLLGRITRIDLTNPVHADDAFAPFIMSHGAVPEWSKEVDIERAQIELLSMIDGSDGRRIPRRRNPSSGTPIEAATADDLARFVNEREHALIVGHIPNSGGLPATVINRHHGGFDDGGYGEARHECIFGQNGSGKTVMATMLLAGKLAAHPAMGLLMPDTAGDLSDPARHDRGDFRWNYVEVLMAAGVTLEIVDVADIRLTSKALLKPLMHTLFLRHLSMGSEKAQELAARVVTGMFEDEVDSSRLTAADVHPEIMDRIGLVYAKASRKEKIEDTQALARDPGWWRELERGLARIRKFFDGRERLGDLIKDVLRKGRKVIIRMDDSRLGQDEQEYVMREVMEELGRVATRIYKAGGDKPSNALVVLDEGARWVPEGKGEADGIGGIVGRAFRETRKYGLGWMVISQRPSDVSKAVLTQSHTRWFGRGVGVGNDRRHLEDHVGKAGLEAYDQLEVEGGYFWVGVGMNANLGTEGTHFAVHPFGGDATRAFVDANPGIFNAVRGAFLGIL